MTSAHRELLDAVRGVRSAIGNRNLQEDEALKKVVARGIYIGAFNFLEGYIQARWLEACSVLNSLSPLCLYNFDSGVQENMIRSQISHLPKKLSPDKVGRAGGPDFAEVCERLHSLLDSISGKGHFAVSVDLFRPLGSNVQADELISAFKLIGINAKSAFGKLARQLFAGVDLGGRTARPLDAFDELSRIRHQAAHDSSFDGQTVFFSTVEHNILLYALCFDIIVSNFVAQNSAVGSSSASCFKFRENMFCNWRAVCLDGDLSCVWVYDFVPGHFKFDERFSSFVNKTCITFEDVKSSELLPLSSRALLKSNDINSDLLVGIFRDSRFQKFIASLCPRELHHGDEVNYFSVFYDPSYGIIDWTLSGDLAF